MKQWWLLMAFLLSVGINIGMLVGSDRSAPAGAVPDTDGTSLETPPETSGESSLAVPPDSPALRRVPHFVYRMADELGLRGDLRAAFVDRQRRFLVETLEARARFSRLQSGLRRELVRHEPSREAADELLRELGSAHAQLERVFVDNLFETRELLSPEQQRRYQRFLQRFRQARDGQAMRRLRDELRGGGLGGPPPGGRPWAGRDRMGRDRPGHDRPGRDGPGRDGPGRDRTPPVEPRDPG